jgi:plastocyanin
MSRFVALCLGGSGIAMAAALACFSERSSSPSDPGLTCARAELPPGPDTVFVIVRGFAFTPAQVNVGSATRVVWINCEPAGTPGHTTTVDRGDWDSPTLLPGEVFSVMPAVGTYDYHCRPHPFMQGQVVVQ